MDESEPIQPSAAPIRAPMRRWKKALLAALALAAVGVLFLTLMDLRARSQLQKFKAQLVAKGEKLALVDHIPKGPLASSNAAPEFMAARRFTRVSGILPMQQLIAPGLARVTWQQPILADRGGDIWPTAFAHLTSNRVALAEVSASLQRPVMVFESEFQKGFEMLVPHLERVREAADHCALAAVAELRATNAPKALAHLLAGIRLIGFLEEPLHISQIVRVSSARPLVQATWEALQFQGWDDQQMGSVQASWQSWDILRGWLAETQLERSMCPIAFVRARGDLRLMVGECLCSDESSWGCKQARAERLGWAVLWRLGYSHADELWSWKQHQRMIEVVREMVASDSFAPAGPRAMADYKPVPEARSMLLVSGGMMPGYMHDILKFATFETTRRLTYTAVALHRHHLRHKEFPTSLAGLVPQFLAEVPRDFMDGQPLRYRRTAAGQFLLWSVGENLKDDDGNPAAEAGRAFNWLRGRDWVWPKAATQAEVDSYHAARAAERAAQDAGNR